MDKVKIELVKITKVPRQDKEPFWKLDGIVSGDKIEYLIFSESVVDYLSGFPEGAEFTADEIYTKTKGGNRVDYEAIQHVVGMPEKAEGDKSKGTSKTPQNSNQKPRNNKPNDYELKEEYWRSKEVNDNRRVKLNTASYAISFAVRLVECGKMEAKSVNVRALEFNKLMYEMSGMDPPKSKE